ncbi:DUF899 domain-containing protein [Actinophytocola oryzae]|uniref:Putative dithiol-disulfide oxidoreductase (DUF899 family) n=1 Tax=Actinophytocola oryzae TaxID=502181 RepID=A0A4R7V979_9PSEU|nr:DUF899 domain-containing protein [Actinophytocola oryzae]TDV45480.1 putative dithiol-disulfide oxidoreductase (DUF899 family) [Actinophytocola oryzae]
MTTTTTLPEVVSVEEWTKAREALLAKEKAALKAVDAVAAERRRLPMVRWDKSYVFHGRDGEKSLLDLFDGRRQLITYHFMMHPGDPHRCPGCSLLVDNIANLEHLHARDTTLVVTAPAPLEESEPYRERMGWTVPWYSTFGSDFTPDSGAGTGFGFSVFLRDGDDVFRTYFTTGRGGDLMVSTLRYLDLTPFGRQEAWEESGRGNDEPSSWWRLHDEY